jgi:uroporphyrinogen-III decarboxylase
MTSRERVLAAVRGDPVDRIPVMVWLNPHATCRLMATYQPAQNVLANVAGRQLWRRFKARGGTEAGEWTRVLPMLLEEYGNGRYAPELGADISIQSPELASPTSAATSIKKQGGHLTFSGPFNATMGLGGIYAYPIKSAVDDVKALAEIAFPELKESLFAGVRKARRRMPETAVVAEIYAFQQVLCDYILGMESFMLALYDAPEAIEAFLNRMADWIVEIIRYTVRAGADVVFLQDDYGADGRPLMSMKMWQAFTYPHLKRFIAVAHEEGVPFMLHSCGYQMPFLEHYVAAELDALQSFQPKAGNDFAAAYAAYGDRLTFATGIDVQRGESMSPAELREDILDAYRTGSTRDRFILSTTHMMQYTMPAANVRAIFDTVGEIQSGAHAA